MTITRIRAWVLLLSGMIVTVMVYWPGLSGGFLFDDYANIVHNDRLKIDNLSPSALIEASFFSFAGSYYRAVSMLSFALNLHFTGMDPYYFKLVNLGLHLVNGVLVYILSLGLLHATRRSGLNRLSDGYIRGIAVIVAVAWLLHPFNVSSVLYIVQRMAILATLFTLLGLVVYVYGRLRMLSGQGRGIEIWIGLPVCALLAGLSKENGVLLIPLAFLVELLIFRFTDQSQNTRRVLYVFFTIFLVIPITVIGIYTLMHPQWLIGGYAVRDFSLAERVMTQSRVILVYLQQIILPNLTSMSLYHDTFETSTSLWSPKTTLPAMLAVAGLIGLAIKSGKRAVVFSLGILFFFIAHSVESTLIPLEIVFEHRNYLPSVGIILVMFYYMLHSGYAQHTLRLRRIGAIAFVMLLAACTLIRADQWSNNLMLSLNEAERNPHSVRANFQAGREYATLSESAPDDISTELYESARYFYLRALELEPGLIEGLIALIILDAINDKPVDETTVSELADELASSRIDPSAVISLRALFNCQLHQRCSLPDNAIIELITAIGDNPYLHGRFASILYSRIAVYLWEHEQDYQSAFMAASRAVAEDPGNIQIQINYAQMLVAIGEYEAVRDIIRQIRESGYGVFYESQLDNLEKKLK